MDDSQREILRVARELYDLGYESGKAKRVAAPEITEAAVERAIEAAKDILECTTVIFDGGPPDLPREVPIADGGYGQIDNVEEAIRAALAAARGGG